MPDKNISDTERKTYEIQPNESTAAFGAFQIYRDLGPDRTRQKTSDLTGKAMGTIINYCNKHNWIYRAQAWDAKIDDARRGAELDTVAAMRKRHIKLARSMQELAADQLRKLAEKCKKNPKKIMDPKLITKMIKDATELERLSCGEPSEIIEASLKAEINYCKLSREELLELKKIKRVLDADKPKLSDYIERTTVNKKNKDD